jgi:hypothetical protein
MKTAAIIGAVIIGLLVLGVFGLAVYRYYDIRTIDRTLATNLSVSSEWIELSFDPPLRVLRRQQDLNIRIPGLDQVQDRGSPPQIKLPDGRVIKPELEIYDEFGNRFEYNFNGFRHSPATIIFVLKYDPERYKSLPQDRSYPRLRIRSDVPFVCERLNWRNSDPYYAN